MKSGFLKLVSATLALALLGYLGWSIYERINEEQGAKRGRGGAEAAPVAVALIERGPMEQRRIFSGALEATELLTISPKVAGRVERIMVDIGDKVTRAQLVAVLDDDEYASELNQARAELEVAKANVIDAENALRIARRELERIKTLRARGVASDSQLDTATANELAEEARVEVARAEQKSAEAALESARIRLGYTEIRALWTEGADSKASERVVSERFVDAGQTVTANSPLLSIVDLDPITAVIAVSERDYGRLVLGQQVSITTDAWPGERFLGEIERIAPVFDKATRQSRVEVAAPNPSYKLKPGMFVRATITLGRIDDAFIVPEAALTERGGEPGVFLISPEGDSAVWRGVTVGIRDGGRVQIAGEGFGAGDRVVTLGQHLISDGAPVIVPGEGAE